MAKCRNGVAANGVAEMAKIFSGNGAGISGETSLGGIAGAPARKQQQAAAAAQCEMSEEETEGENQSYEGCGEENIIGVSMKKPVISIENGVAYQWRYNVAKINRNNRRESVI
jgi:hypothetical protein